MDVAREGPGFGSMSSVTAALDVPGTMPETLTHGWNDVAPSGHPSGVPIVTVNLPPVFPTPERSFGASEYVHADSGTLTRIRKLSKADKLPP